MFKKAFFLLFSFKPDQHPNPVHYSPRLHNSDCARLGRNDQQLLQTACLRKTSLLEVLMALLLPLSIALSQFTPKHFQRQPFQVRQHFHPCLCRLCQALGYAASPHRQQLFTFHTGRAKQMENSKMHQPIRSWKFCYIRSFIEFITKRALFTIFHFSTLEKQVTKNCN